MKRRLTYHRLAVNVIVISAVVLFGASSAPGLNIIDISPDQSSLDATNANGASGGRVNGLGAVPGDNNVFYAASEWGGLFKSADGGQKWKHLPAHLPTATWDVAVDPDDTNRVYATSFYDGRVDSIAGINVSTDGGLTWTHPATATPPEDFCADPERRTEPGAFGIAIDPDEPRNVWVGTSCGLAMSVDRGATWIWIDPTPADGADDVWDVVVHNGIVDVCGDDGHVRRDETGTWTSATSAPLPAGRCSLAASPEEKDTLFAVSGISIFETTDGGTSWPTTYANPAAQGRIPFLAVNDRSGAGFDLWFGDVRLFQASCSTPTGGGAAARCPGSGSWTDMTGNAHFDSGDLAFDSTVTTDSCPKLFSSDGGIYLNTTTTTPGCQTPTWEQPTVTPHALYVLDFEGSQVTGNTGEDLYIGNQDNGSFGALDGGAANPTWTNRACCDTFDVAASNTTAVTTTCCFGAGRFNRLTVRGPGLAGGGQLSNANHPTGNVPSFNFLDMVDSFGADDFVVVTTSGVFITQNINATNITWTQLGAATSPAGACGIQVAKNGSTTSFFVKSGGCNGNRTGSIFRFDGIAAGGSWTQVTRPGAGGFGVFAVDPRDPDTILASDLNGPSGVEMVLTEDGGATWDNLPQLDDLMTGGGVFRYENETGPTVLPSSASMRFSGYAQPNMVAISPKDGATMVAGAVDAGFFLSTNRGSSWSLVTDPLTPATSGTPHIPRPRYAHFEHGNLLNPEVKVWVGSHGRGVWKLTLQPRLRPCDRFPWLCGDIDFDRDIIIAECLIRGCRLLDPIPRNCLVKWNCPGCPPQGLCPPWFHVFIEDVEDAWRFDLIDRYGDGVPHELVRTDGGVVLSFRPSKKEYIEGSIGDFFIELEMGPEGKVGKRYMLESSVKAADGPYRAKAVKPIQRHGFANRHPEIEAKGF